jgi:hypothetical protein
MTDTRAFRTGGKSKLGADVERITPIEPTQAKGRSKLTIKSLERIPAAEVAARRNVPPTPPPEG